MNKTVENLIKRCYQKLKPFKDIIWFFCLFLIFEFIWKLCVHQGEDESVLLVLGKDLTAYTENICIWTADSVYWTIHNILGYNDFYINGTFLQFKNSLLTNIVWGCTGLKQLFMFAFIIAFYYGPAKKKLWYIPMSLLILIAVNILRLIVIFLIIRNPFPEWFITVNEWYNNRIWSNSKENYIQFYTDWFNIFHRDIFTWLYYDGIIFILWLVWEEKINKSWSKMKN
ncbi:MAG: exosortase/archaeosortase family protein [Prevotella sp.]|jgi:exosortase/archaeosortase family protein|nr:exosortase/archaeosortase family protein [Prevotella sp.]